MALALLSGTLLVSSHANAQSNSAIIATLPGILCLLLCDEPRDDNAPPDLQDRGGTITLVVGHNTNPIRFTNTGGVILTVCGTSPPLPAGLSVRVSADQLTCEIVGSPNAAQSSTLYTITASNASGDDQATIEIEVLNAFPVGGIVLYERVPTQTGPPRLNYNAIAALPVRQATVELLDVDDMVIDTTVTDDNGEYQFDLNSDQSVRVRVKAELLRTTGTNRYNVVVVDNTAADALYALTEGSAALASARATRDLTAASGWDGAAYSSTRASAPFALLDSTYEAMRDFIQADANIVFPSLTINWSVDNRPSSGNTSNGDIGTSFYSAGNIFILGAVDNDTDEFDDHVVIHEWGHYFEDNLSRSDSIGGSHGGGDLLDMRVAFGEGFGNALSGIVTDDPLYVDTFGNDQALGFFIDVDDNTVSNPGWYSESSVQAILYDLYDSNDDTDDSVSLGLSPLYQVLINEQKNTELFTSIFSFISALKANQPGAASVINQLVNGQSINGTSITANGSNETNNAGVANVLPVYTTLTVDGGAANVCTIANFNNGGDINKLSNVRYLTFTIPSAGNYTVTASKTMADYADTDPDILVLDHGTVRIISEEADVDFETATGFLNAGPHVLALQEFNVFQNAGVNSTACFDVSVTTTAP